MLAPDQVVHVEIDRARSGLLIGHSKDLKGLTVAAYTEDDLLAQVPKVIENMYKAIDRRVFVQVHPHDERTFIVKAVGSATP